MDTIIIRGLALGGGGGGTPLYKLYRYNYAAPKSLKGMVFEPFWSENGCIF